MAAPPVTAMSAPSAAKAVSSAPSTGYMDLPVNNTGGMSLNLEGIQQGISDAFNNPFRPITDIAKAPIQWGMQGIDYVSEQANNIWKLLSGGR